MSLINCPECGKEISDKSEKCIHCGYPIRNIPYICENINGKDYEVSFLLNHSESQMKQIQQLTKLSGCDLFTAKNIVLKYHPTPKEDTDKVHCPKCKSISITTGARGVNFMFGLLGASKTVNHCAKCGYTWKP